MAALRKGIVSVAGQEVKVSLGHEKEVVTLVPIGSMYGTFSDIWLSFYGKCR